MSVADLDEIERLVARSSSGGDPKGSGRGGSLGRLQGRGHGSHCGQPSAAHHTTVLHVVCADIHTVHIGANIGNDGCTERRPNHGHKDHEPCLIDVCRVDVAVANSGHASQAPVKGGDPVVTVLLLAREETPNANQHTIIVQV